MMTFNRIKVSKKKSIRSKMWLTSCPVETVTCRVWAQHNICLSAGRINSDHKWVTLQWMVAEIILRLRREVTKAGRSTSQRLALAINR